MPPLPPSPNPTNQPTKTTRTVCNQPQANLLKNISKAKITKTPIPPITYTSDTHSKSHLVTSHSLSEIFQSDCGVGITGFYKN
jgi:hypothetical protein